MVQARRWALAARDTKLGTWVHLGKAYLAPFDLRGWGAYVHVQ